ncbi:hypothetical protein Aduo_016175 [Ancylostoma duodenale]
MRRRRHLLSISWRKTKATVLSRRSRRLCAALKSKIVRSLNRIEDPDGFLKSINGYSAKIAGLNGKTVSLTNDSDRVHQINPNDRLRFSLEYQKDIPKIRKIGRLRQCLGCDYEPHEFLRNLTAWQKGRLNKMSNWKG